MKFLDYILKIFKSNKETSDKIALLSTYIPLLKREELNEEDIEKLNIYKQDYLSILSQKRTTYSGDFNSGNLRKDMNMYLELILNNLENVKEINWERDNSYSGNKELNTKEKILRLEYYLYYLISLQKDTLIRLTALNEIRNEKFFLRPAKKLSINEEINNLSSNYLTFENSIYALIKEIKAFESIYINLFREMKDIWEEMVNERLKELTAMIKLICPSRLENIQKEIDGKDNIVKLTLLEITLEEYIYKNKNIADNLKDEILEIKDDRDSLTNDKLLEKIKKLELKCQALSEFGYKLINRSDVLELYNIKFDILKENIYNMQDGEIIKNAPIIEVECYTKIIEEKIEEIIKSFDIKIEGLPITQNPNYLKLFKKVLKDENSTFSYKEILIRNKLLAFLLAFDNHFTVEEKLREYFNKTFLRFYKVKGGVALDDEIYRCLTYFNDIFGWKDILPASSIYTIMMWNNEKSNDPLFELFKLLQKDNITNKYYLPEGLGSIYITEENLKDPYFKDLFRKINELSNRKILITPKSLETLNGVALDIINPSAILLSEGLKYFEVKNMKDINLDYIVFPSTIEKVSFASSSESKNITIKNIYINGYTPELIEKILLNSGIIYYLFRIKEISRKTLIKPGNILGEYQKSHFNYYAKIKYRVIPKFDEIHIKYNEEEIILKRDDFNKEIESIGIERLSRRYDSAYIKPTFREQEEIYKLIKLKINDEIFAIEEIPRLLNRL